MQPVIFSPNDLRVRGRMYNTGRLPTYFYTVLFVSKKGGLKTATRQYKFYVLSGGNSIIKLYAK